jgi:hypothetical protein
MIPRIVLCCVLSATLLSGTVRADSWQVDAMADTAQWTLSGQRLHYSLGTSKLEAAATPTRPGARKVLNLICDLAERSWIGLQWQGEPLAGRPERLSFWLHGDKCGHKLVGRMEDAAGRAYQVPLGAITFAGWREIEVSMEPARWTPVPRQGDCDAPVRWPVSLREIRVLKSNEAALAVTVALSELRAVGRRGPLDRVRVRLSCAAAAHVFYDGEPLQVQAQIENPEAEPLVGQLEAVVCDWLGREQRYALGALGVAPGKTHQDTYRIPVERLGSYTLWLRVVGQSGVAEACQRLAVSRRRPATAIDPGSPMGMGLYLPRFDDEKQLELAFTLAREAGVKWTRGDLSIAECLPEPGQWAWDAIRWETSPHGYSVVLGPHMRLKVADSASLNRPCVTGELTIALRLRLNSLDYPDRWRTLLSKGDGGSRQWYLFWDVKTHQLGLSLGDGMKHWSDSHGSKRDWQPGRWYEIVVAHRRADRLVEWWIDGQRAGMAKTAFAQTLVRAPVAMTIGGGLNCGLDDLAIYDRCLDGGALAAAAPVARWSFDEGRGREILDRSGNKNDIRVEPWRYDGIFARSRREGISTYCVVMGTPLWMVARPSNGQDRPRLSLPRLDEWSAAFEKIVARQKQAGIRTWEIWNEPNIKSFWSPEPNAEEYARVLLASYQAIKRADPGATVLGCALAGPNGPRYRQPYGFVEAVLKRGAGQAMDAISIHPYRQPRTPEESGYLEDLQAISDLTAKYGRRLPIWISEIGWPTDPSGSSELRSAQMLVRSYLLAIAHGVQNIAWYDYRDDGTDPSYNEHHFGVLYHDMTPKPSYFAFRTMATELAGLKFEREVAAGEGVSLLVFGDGRRHAAVAWSHQGAKQLAFQMWDRHHLQTVDLMGNAQDSQLTDGALLTAVDETPVFLRDVPPSLAVVRPIEASPGVLKAIPGEQSTLQIVLRNPFFTPLRLRWAENVVDLAPGGEKRIALTRSDEAWRVDATKPWRSDGGMSLTLPAQVAIIEGQREPVLRWDAETRKPIELPGSVGANATDEVTVAARFRSDGPSGTWQSPVTKWDADRRNWGLYLSREKGELTFSASWTKRPGAFHDVSSEHALFDRRWHRVAVTYSAYDAQLCYYVDGTLVRQIPCDGGKLLTNQAPVRLAGGFTDGRVKPARTMAAVSQVRVWNRALSADEIRKLDAP